MPVPAKTARASGITHVTLERIAQRKPVTEKHDPWILGYRTKGGSYIVASNGRQTDSGKPHDLMLIRLDGSVVVLRPNVNPAAVADVRRYVRDQYRPF